MIASARPCARFWSAKPRCRSSVAAPSITCARSSRSFERQGYDAELVSVPFKWYPKHEILTHAAAWRLLDLSESNGRPIDLVDRDEVPDVLRASSAQGRVAHSSVPRRVRARRHTLQRLRPHARGCRAARAPRRARHGDARRVPPRVRERRNDGTTRARDSTASTSTALYHPPRLAARLRRGPMGDYLLSVGRLEVVKRVELAIRAMRHAPDGLSLKIAGTGTRGRELEALTRHAGPDEPRRVPRRGRRRRSRRPLQRRARSNLSSVRRGLRLRHARGVSVRQTRRHHDRRRRSHGVRRGRREWSGHGAGPGSARRGDRVSRGGHAAGRLARRCRLRSGAPDHLGGRDRSAWFRPPE